MRSWNPHQPAIERLLVRDGFDNPGRPGEFIYTVSNPEESDRPVRPGFFYTAQEEWTARQDSADLVKWRWVGHHMAARHFADAEFVPAEGEAAVNPEPGRVAMVGEGAGYAGVRP